MAIAVTRRCGGLTAFLNAPNSVSPPNFCSDKKSGTPKKKPQQKKTVGYLRRPHVTCRTPTRGRNPPQEINGSPRGPNMLGLPVVSISHYQAFYTGSDRRHSGIMVSQLCTLLFDTPRVSRSGRLCHNLNANDHISVKSRLLQPAVMERIAICRFGRRSVFVLCFYQ